MQNNENREAAKKKENIQWTFSDDSDDDYNILSMIYFVLVLIKVFYYKAHFML